MFEVPRLKLRPGTGNYSKGQARVVEILEAALDVLLDEGYQALTMRRIAKACGITVGNVTYYYKSKDDLVRDLLTGVLESYMDIFDHIASDTTKTAEEKFVTVIRLLLEDITSKKTTHLFPQLWALSNHDPFIAECVDEMYTGARAVLNRMIPEINPNLSEEEQKLVALFVSASIEGMTVFAGYNKPWRPHMQQIEGIAAKSLLDCVKNITSEDINRFRDKDFSLDDSPSAPK
ncbi:MAG: TetR/AcrR family transcriptional regulator [Alphaproteobacteria bacterium]|nr:MAG: TetR/AcrR family transcriptional regulator [Alphaproteobacteria bacterium]